MTKTQQLDSLFEEWEQTTPDYRGKFVRDGIVDEGSYDAAKHKILFVAKEPNNREQQAGDFRVWWEQGLKYGFSLRIAEWAHGIENDFPLFDEIKYELGGNRTTAIRKIAFMNLKKIGGTGNSTYSEIEKHLKQNKAFIERQVEITNPDYIILGLSWKELRNELFSNKVDWKNSGYDIHIGKKGRTKIIDFYHPSSRNAPSASYSLLQNIFRSKSFKEL